MPKVQTDLVIGSERFEEVVETITNAARTGRIGDGKIFVSDVAKVIGVRNGDRGAGAV